MFASEIRNIRANLKRLSEQKDKKVDSDIDSESDDLREDFSDQSDSREESKPNLQLLLVSDSNTRNIDQHDDHDGGDYSEGSHSGSSDEMSDPEMHMSFGKSLLNVGTTGKTLAEVLQAQQKLKGSASAKKNKQNGDQATGL